MLPEGREKFNTGPVAFESHTASQRMNPWHARPNQSVSHDLGSLNTTEVRVYVLAAR